MIFISLLAFGSFMVRTRSAEDGFIAQDRNEDFEGGQIEATFSSGHCDLTSDTISKILLLNERYGYYLFKDTP